MAKIVELIRGVPARSEELLSLAIRGQVAVDAAVWEATSRDPMFLYRGDRLICALEHIDIRCASVDELVDVTIVDFLRASSHALETIAS